MTKKTVHKRGPSVAKTRAQRQVKAEIRHAAERIEHDPANPEQARHLSRLDLTDESVRNVLRALCVGQYVRQVDGGDCTAERRLLAYASAVNRAVAIALVGTEFVLSNTGLDVEFYDEDAATALVGVAALLDAAPKLLDSLAMSGVEIGSRDGATRNPTRTGDA